MIRSRKLSPLRRKMNLLRLVHLIAAFLFFTNPALTAIYADIDQTSTVTNIVIWDGSTYYPIQSGHQLIPYAPPAGIGSIWGGSVFSAPPAITASSSQPAYDAYGAASAAQAAAIAAAPGLAPVQSVNTKGGAVIVPTLCRMQSAALAIPTSSNIVTNPSTVTWTFPTGGTCAFSAPPSCWMDMSTSTSGYSFDQPLNTARSTTAVTYVFTAHATTLTIALGSLSLSVGPSANSTVVMTSAAPPA